VSVNSSPCRIADLVLGTRIGGSSEDSGAGDPCESSEIRVSARIRCDMVNFWSSSDVKAERDAISIGVVGDGGIWTFGKFLQNLLSGGSVYELRVGISGHFFW
jgi:hypothetical protein